MKRLVTVLAVSAKLAVVPAVAEEHEPARKFQIAPYAGALVPTGDQRTVFAAAVLVGVTVSCDVSRSVAVVGSVSWAPSRGRGFARNADLDVHQYDLGARAQFPFGLGDGVTLKPFIGAGVAGRTYAFRALDVAAETDLVGYLAVGAGLECRGAALGLAVRDYGSRFDGIGGEEGASTRNDLALIELESARRLAARDLRRFLGLPDGDQLVLADAAPPSRSAPRPIGTASGPRWTAASRSSCSSRRSRASGSTRS